MPTPSLLTEKTVWATSQQHPRYRVRVAALELDDCILQKGPPRSHQEPKFVVYRSTAITAIRTDTTC